MTDELTVLRDAFGPAPVPPAGARDRARAALLGHIGGGAAARTRIPARRRWLARVAVTAAVAALAVVGAVVVENLGTVDEQGRRHPMVTGLPFPEPASAAEVLENAAWAAGGRPWKAPRPDQFMFKESQELRNVREIEQQAPNGPMIPGKTRILLVQDWKRIDARVWGHTQDGRLLVEEQGAYANWGQIPYADLVGLTTPEKVLAWDVAPKQYGMRLDALLGQYVLPPAVEAAVFRAIARGDGVRLNPDAVNVDGRPALGLGRVIDGYLSQELLFDQQTYALIGERMVAVADHTDVGDDGTSLTRKGDVFRQVIYTASRIVDRVGDTG